MSGANVPRNLKYDQSDQSTLAETLISKQAPEGRTSSFGPLQKIDIRIPTSGGFVDSFASSTLNFDLDITNAGAGASAFLDPWLGGHQLIQRIVVTAGGNIIEDITDYPICYKLMKGLHGNQSRIQLDACFSESDSSSISFGGFGQNLNWWSTADTVYTNTTQRYKCRLNLMSCVGSLSGAKYWPSALMDSDLRIEIYLNSQLRGMICETTDMTWQLNNVEFQLTRVRLNTRIIEALKASAMAGGVKMIMPGFSHFQETLNVPSTLGNTVAFNTRYSSSASSLKSILVTFRNSIHNGAVTSNAYQFVDPIGLEYQFLIGSTLMPARPVNTSVDKYRELMRCMGGPLNSLGQRNLINYYGYNTQILNRAMNVATDGASCHAIGQSLEMYADHTLSSTVFSGVNAINLTMQCHLKVTAAAGTNERDSFTTVADNVVNKLNQVPTDEGATNHCRNVSQTLLVDSILVFDRLINFTGTEVTMGY